MTNLGFYPFLGFVALVVLGCLWALFVVRCSSLTDVTDVECLLFGFAHSFGSVVVFRRSSVFVVRRSLCLVWLRSYSAGVGCCVATTVDGAAAAAAAAVRIYRSYRLCAPYRVIRTALVGG
jgi:hypothetical protein